MRTRARHVALLSLVLVAGGVATSAGSDTPRPRATLSGFTQSTGAASGFTLSVKIPQPPDAESPRDVQPRDVLRSLVVRLPQGTHVNAGARPVCRRQVEHAGACPRSVLGRGRGTLSTGLAAFGDVSVTATLFRGSSGPALLLEATEPVRASVVIPVRVNGGTRPTLTMTAPKLMSAPGLPEIGVRDLSLTVARTGWLRAPRSCVATGWSTTVEMRLDSGQRKAGQRHKCRR